jgi:hypothetical protein
MKDSGEYYTRRERERERAKTVPSGFNLVSLCSILFIIPTLYYNIRGNLSRVRIESRKISPISFDKMSGRIYNYLKHVNKKFHVS